MKFSLFFMTLFLALNSSALTCSSEDSIGTQGKLSWNSNRKEITLTVHGSAEVIFDSKTICGFKPKEGLAKVSCPFATQTIDDYSLIDLECTDLSHAEPYELTRGELVLRAGGGSLTCAVMGDLRYFLTLTNCH